MNRFVCVIIVGLTAACGSATDDEPMPPTVPAPLYGPADSVVGDMADRDCRVVLRSAERVDDDAGLPESNCTDNRCWQVFEGEFDVLRRLAEDGTPSVLYRSREGDYHVAEAMQIDGAVAGYSRYAFRLDENTIAAGVPSMTGARAHIEVLPFVEVGERRYFDHNLNTEATDNYDLNARGGWSFEQRSDVCPATEGATVRFFEDWTHEEEGTIVPGGALKIEYDLSRLPQCVGRWHNGRLAWQVGVTMKFPPDERLVRRQLMAADGAEALPTPAEVFVPTDARAVEMWFHTSGAGCETHYDSNDSQNYSFPVDR